MKSGGKRRRLRRTAEDEARPSPAEAQLFDFGKKPDPSGRSLRWIHELSQRVQNRRDVDIMLPDFRFETRELLL